MKEVPDHVGSINDKEQKENINTIIEIEILSQWPNRMKPLWIQNFV